MPVAARPGVHGVTVAGSTGEGHTLSGEEAHRAAAATMAAVDGAAPVIAGIIANSTRAVVQRGTALAELGVAALQITPVHYLFRPDATMRCWSSIALPRNRPACR